MRSSLRTHRGIPPAPQSVQSAANAPTISKTDKDRDGNWGFISSVCVEVLVQKLRPPHKFIRAASNTLVSQITLWLRRFEGEPTPKKRAAPTEMNGGFSSAERRPMSKSLEINSARLAPGGWRIGFGAGAASAVRGGNRQSAPARSRPVQNNFRKTVYARAKVKCRELGGFPGRYFFVAASVTRVEFPSRLPIYSLAPAATGRWAAGVFFRPIGKGTHDQNKERQPTGIMRPAFF